jgi:hypothetical protein
LEKIEGMEELERRPIRKKRDKSLGEHIADEPRFRLLSTFES